MNRRETLPIDTFLNRLAARLDHLGAVGVRAALEKQARSLRPSERAAFLAIFAGDAGDGRDSLLAEVDDVVAEVATLRPSPRGRRNWYDDDDLDDDGVASSVEDLLIAAGERFLAGDHTIAMQAYERIFDAVAETVDNDDRGGGIELDPEVAGEALDSLLWCIGHYGDGDARQRAAHIVDVIDKSSGTLPMPTDGGFLAIHPTAAAIPEDVTLAVIERINADYGGWTDWRARSWHELAFALLEQLEGLAALVELARADESGGLEVYRWLTGRRVAIEDFAGAADLALEGMARGRLSYDLAVLADTAVELCAWLGRSADAHAAAIRAWQAGPSAARLTALCHFAPEEIAVVAADPPQDRFLATAVALLDGDLGEVVRLGRTTDGLRGCHGSVGLGIVACCAFVGEPAGRRLVDALVGGETDHHTAFERLRAQWQTFPRVEVVGLTDRLLAAINNLAPPSGGLDDPSAAAIPVDDASSATGALADARALLDALATEVLGTKQRDSYGLVAELIVHVARATSATTGRPVAEMVDEFDERYRRFSAFRAELRAAALRHDP